MYELESPAAPSGIEERPEAATGTRRILITNAMALNGGDAAILQATVAMLRQAFGANATFTVYDMRAEAAARYHDDLRFRPQLFTWIEAHAKRRLTQIAVSLGILLLAAARNTAPGRRLMAHLPDELRQTLADYAEADLVVSSGGTYLVPHYEVYSKLFDFLLARALGRRLVLFTQSLGPFPRGKRRLLLRYVLRRAHLILVRDEKSRRALDALGVPAGRVRLCADAAFALAPASLRGRHFPPPRKPWRIAISVRDWPHFRSQVATTGMERYLTAIAALTTWLVERHGAEITFVSTCQGTPEYWTDDGRTAERIIARLPADIARHLTCNRAFHKPAELVEALQRHDLVVATRLHVAILALCAGTPVLPIAYEFKTRELFGRFGLDHATLDIESISPERLIEAFENAARFWRAHATETWSKVREERRSAFDAARHVEALFANPLETLDERARDGRIRHRAR
jgi:colanic acid/amylovoran biosynthesis protein